MRFSFDPYRDPYGTAERKESDRTGEQVTHGLSGLFLRRCGDMGIGVQRNPGGVMPQHPGDRFDVHTVLQGERCECVPLRYNYSKPEKPRISRIFGYLARFFILFQTEKLSREVVIS